jgi:hypothetical protein
VGFKWYVKESPIKLSMTDYWEVKGVLETHLQHRTATRNLLLGVCPAGNITIKDCNCSANRVVIELSPTGSLTRVDVKWVYCSDFMLMLFARESTFSIAQIINIFNNAFHDRLTPNDCEVLDNIRRTNAEIASWYTNPIEIVEETL